jgi:hypothetical protein
MNLALERFRAGKSLDDAFADFLDEFFILPTKELQEEFLSDEPSSSGDARLDALAGAVAEYLAKQHRLGKVPKWASDRSRYLEHAWHLCDYNDRGRREFLTFSSPAEFCSRNIFTVERPLHWGRGGRNH